MLNQSWVHAVGTESDDFPVNIPVTRPNANYLVTGALAGVTNLVAMDFPNGAGDRTATHFRVVTSSPVKVGDKIEFQIFDLLPSTLSLHPFGSISNGSWSVDTNGYMKNSGAGILYIPIPFNEGDQINGVTIAAKGNGSISLTMTVYVLSGSGVKTSLGAWTWSPTSSFADTALGLTSTTLAAGQSLYFELNGTASGLYIGSARVHYDRP